MRQIATQLGAQSDLALEDGINFEEFNKIFCKGMFKEALGITIDKLQEGLTRQKPDGTVEFTKNNPQMPLSVKIEQY